MSVAGAARIPGTLSQRIGLIGAAWVAVGLGISLVVLAWQAVSAREAWNVDPRFLMPAAVFASASFGLRTVRWHTFLRAAGIYVGWPTSLRTQLVGFALTMTPVKVGELYKAYLIERATRAPGGRTAPIVIFEKMMDGVAFSSLALVAGATLILTEADFLQPGSSPADSFTLAARSLLAIVVAASVVGLVLRALGRSRTERALSGLLVRLPFGARAVGVISSAMQGGADVLRPRLLLQNMAVTLAARTCDGLAMWCVAAALGLSLTPLAGVFVLNSSGALGGLSMLPGGIGVVEAGMSLVLVGFGAPASQALIATLLARLFCFWAWVVVGLGLLLRASLAPHTEPTTP